MKIFIPVPVEEWKTPKSWEFDNNENPIEVFAIGGRSSFHTVWAKSMLKGITHVLVEKEMICFTPGELGLFLNEYFNNYECTGISDGIEFLKSKGLLNQ